MHLNHWRLKDANILNEMLIPCVIEFYLLHFLLILAVFEGVQKERMQPEDMYILSANGSIISSPSPKPYPNKPPKCTDCAPLFMKVWF